jgi:hypothetical protein
MFNVIEVLDCRSRSRSSKPQELDSGPVPHSVPGPAARTEVAEVPRVSMGGESGSLRFARAPTKEDSSSMSHHQSTRRAADSRAKTKWLEKLATRASYLVGPPRVRRSFSKSSARRRAAAPVG